MRFSGKTVYVTQADTAQGEALALRFAKEGANLVLGFGKEDLVKKVEDLGAKAMVVQPDMLTYEGAEALVEEVKKTFGRIDALIFNNNNVVKTGLHMAEYHSGKIVFVSSIHCDKPTGSAVMYSISKGCINMLCKECALFFGRRGIQTNLIEAGAVEGDDEKFESTFSPLYAMGYMEERIPRRKAGTPEEIAAVAAFLASDDASFVNGASVRADGGFELFYGFKA